jgi:1,5-anhydro-D-fructose reductase (1,5-anhydro-D-mannitol-forming)
MSTSGPVGWGLIGASTIAREYMIPAINAQPDGRVVAVMSRSAERGRRYANDNGIERSYADLGGLLADRAIGAVFISTTNERHCAETLAAAAAGKHVLCDKPLALTLADARAMVEACRAAGVVMGANHHLRSGVAFRAMRRLVRDGAIGTPLAARVFHAVYLPDHLQTWRIKDPSTGAGVVLDLTVHDTDWLRFLLDDEVEDVTAVSAQQGLATGPIEDAVMGVMRFRHGVLAQFHDAFTIKHAATGIQLHGSEGSIFGDGVIAQRPAGRVTLRRNESDETIPLDTLEDPYAHVVRCFHQAIRGEGPPSATGEDGLRSLGVALATLEAAQTGRRVTARYD